MRGMHLHGRLCSGPRILAPVPQRSRPITHQHASRAEALTHTRYLADAWSVAEAVVYKLALLSAPALAAVTIWAQPAAAAEDLTIKFKASSDPEVKAAQQTLVEAWGYANLQFLDQTFNGLDWRSELQVHSMRHAQFSARAVPTACAARDKN